ncbi:hypothetical protein CAEBREN_22082 [Caenorhabditis brenneri]|uniref:Uncharacterized protein n=1 Tax=Caenorhabditis brenneri TaxID=135651 RepID=G0NI36_CAEBE|nr:hypothetical protein CAEBREN_22082 [Caenorhabditis brenneri]
MEYLVPTVFLFIVPVFIYLIVRLKKGTPQDLTPSAKKKVEVQQKKAQTENAISGVKGLLQTVANKIDEIKDIKHEIWTKEHMIDNTRDSVLTSRLHSEKMELEVEVEGRISELQCEIPSLKKMFEGISLDKYAPFGAAYLAMSFSNDVQGQRKWLQESLEKLLTLAARAESTGCNSIENYLSEFQTVMNFMKGLINQTILIIEQMNGTK